MTAVSAANHHHRHRHAAPAFPRSTTRSPFLPALLALFFFIGIFCHRDFVEEAATLEKQQKQQRQQQNKHVQLDPKHLLVNDVEVFLQVPSPSRGSSSSSTVVIEGVVLLFHGCNHDGIDWFELPEDCKIVRYLLEQNFAAIAISSESRQGSRCWDSSFPADRNVDAMRIQSALPEILQEHIHVDGNGKIASALPMYAIGASSGGVFSSILCQVFPFVGISAIVAPGQPEAWEWMANENNNHDGQTTMTTSPAVAFVYMPKDAHFAGPMQVMAAQEQLEGRYPTKAFACEPKPITATWIHEGIPSIRLERAESIVDTLSRPPLSIIDKQTYKLKQDPRRVWGSIVKASLGGLSDLEVASVEELFNVGWASHEMTSEHLPEVVRFWKEHNSLHRSPNRSMEVYA